MPIHEHGPHVVPQRCIQARKCIPQIEGEGAELKDVAAGVFEAWCEFAHGFRSYEAVETALRNLVQAQDLLHSHRDEIFLPDDAVVQLQEHIDTFLVAYQGLAYRAESGDGELLWNNPSKFHHLWHLARKAKYINPRRTNVFLDEDFVGRMKTLCHSCSPGSELHQMVYKMAYKYQWGTHFLAMAAE